MPYRAGYMGDYRGGYQGDLFSAALGLGKGLLGKLRKPKAVPLPPIPTTMPGGARIQKTGGLKGFIQRAAPGGATGYEMIPPKRRRMNPANPKALKRAIRREKAFVDLAKRTLKGSGYTIKRTGLGTARKKR